MRTSTLNAPWRLFYLSTSLNLASIRSGSPVGWVPFRQSCPYVNQWNQMVGRRVSWKYPKFWSLQILTCALIALFSLLRDALIPSICLTIQQLTQHFPLSSGGNWRLVCGNIHPTDRLIERFVTWRHNGPFVCFFWLRLMFKVNITALPVLPGNGLVWFWRKSVPTVIIAIRQHILVHPFPTAGTPQRSRVKDVASHGKANEAKAPSTCCSFSTNQTFFEN